MVLLCMHVCILHWVWLGSLVIWGNVFTKVRLCGIVIRELLYIYTFKHGLHNLAVALYIMFHEIILSIISMV